MHDVELCAHHPNSGPRDSGNLRSTRMSSLIPEDCEMAIRASYQSMLVQFKEGAHLNLMMPLLKGSTAMILL